MRRLDIEDAVGSIPVPDIDGGGYLLDVLFQVGPIAGDRPLNEGDLEPWERRRGIELQPWQAELLVDLSRAYMGESHAARKYDAQPPWPDAVPMWRWVRNNKAERSWDRLEKEANGRS